MQSRALFDRALALDPEFLGNHLDFAQHYARRAGEAAAYEAALERIRVTSARSPEEEIAKRKAARL